MKYISDIWNKFIASLQAKKTPTIKYMFPLMIGFFAVLGASVITSESSYIRLEPSQTAVMEGERFSIDIYASAHVPVNALDITIDFSPDKVQIISVDKGLSVLNIWTQEPKIENNSITLGGGTYRRGFVGEHLVATIKAEAKFNGVTEFLVRDAKLLAGDGKGTPVAVTGTGDASKTSFYIYDQNEDPTSITANLGISINADIDADGKVTLKDISAFISAWNSDTKTYDFNSDGKMNFVDFSIILAKSFMDF
jgi:anti-sigma regulatory factor (Ser/Thr protein kinase)